MQALFCFKIDRKIFSSFLTFDNEFNFRLQVIILRYKYNISIQLYHLIFQFNYIIFNLFFFF